MADDLDAILAEIERGEYDEEVLYRAVEALVGRIQELEAEIENSVSLYWQRRAEKAEAAHEKAVRIIASLDSEAEARAVKAEAERDTALDVARQATEDYRREEEAARKYLAERDELREALEAALDCGGPYGGTVSRDHGQRAICSLCEGKARAALTQGAGEEQERKAREETEFEVRRRQRSNGWRNV